MIARGRKQVIAILLKLKAKGLLKEFFRGSVPRAGAHQLPASRPTEGLRRAVLASAPIDKAWRMSGRGVVGGASSRPYVLHLRGGQKALFKPLNTGGNSEILAYHTSKVLGFPSVPPTVLRETPWGMGSAQQWVRGRERAPVDTALLEAVRAQKHSGGKIVPPILKQYREMRAFDFLIDNYDRVPGNFKWDPRSSRLLVIDNAEGFLSNRSPQTTWEVLSMERTLWDMSLQEKQQIGKKLKAFLRKRDHLEGLVSKLPSEAIEGITLDPVFQRAEFLLDRLGKPVKVPAPVKGHRKGRFF